MVLQCIKGIDILDHLQVDPTLDLGDNDGGDGDGTPNPYNALLSGEYQLHTVEFESFDLIIRSADIVADGQDIGLSLLCEFDAPGQLDVIVLEIVIQPVEITRRSLRSGRGR